MSNYISTDSDWTFDMLETYDREIARVAALYGLDTYPNQIEVISAEQMMDAYSSVGMPIGYNRVGIQAIQGRDTGDFPVVGFQHVKGPV